MEYIIRKQGQENTFLHDTGAEKFEWKSGHAGAARIRENVRPLIQLPQSAEWVAAPRFSWDCEECVFLGAYRDFDLYEHCLHGSDTASVHAVVVVWGSPRPREGSGVEYAIAKNADAAASFPADQRDAVEEAYRRLAEQRVLGAAVTGDAAELRRAQTSSTLEPNTREIDHE